VRRSGLASERANLTPCRRGKKMSARNKLNAGYTAAAVAGAVLVGLLLQSWWGFVVGLVVLVGLNLHAGNIRPTGRRR
jgi:hypothetical protein